MKITTSLFSVLTLAAACTAQAAIVMTISQVGNDIVLTGSGTLNIDGLTQDAGTSSVGSLLAAGDAIILSGAYDTLYYGYSSDDMTGPENFGYNLGAYSFGDGFGDFFGAQGTPFGNAIFVADGYVSGSFLSGSSIFVNTTFEDIGLVAGNYVWTWSTSEGTESFSLNVIAVPEPAHYAIGAGLAALALVALRRRVK